MPLKLLHSPSPPSTAFDPAPLDLTHRPTRPGLAFSELALELGPELCARAAATAAADGQPLNLWAAWVIESERVLAELGDLGPALRADLDLLAERPDPPTPGGAARLGEYAQQLRRTFRAASAASATMPAQMPAVRIPGRLSLLVPDASLTAWRRAAIAADQTLEDWAGARLAGLPRMRASWEAAAAERGETLAEFVLAQAARRAAA
jgi:hypothetical protein